MAGSVFDTEGLAPTISTMGGGNRQPMIFTNDKLKDTSMENIGQENKQINLPTELEGKPFRIRKLTPRECFRLMGVDDADIDKIQASGVSNSAQYKLAGNSIVVDVLFHLFRKMFIETDPDAEQGAAVQMSLF
jgi:site-specific DNA-cytosine methylase